MKIQEPTNNAFGAIVTDFDAATATSEDFASLKEAIYQHRLVVLKNQEDITPEAFIRIGEHLGEIVPYYEPMYHHPDHKEIFVSANTEFEGRKMGVPKTGKFWHADYQFKPQPFAFTIFAPKILPAGNRGTFFINMADAFNGLPEAMKDKIRGTKAGHSVRRFFKIRPSDVYRPLGEIVSEVEQASPETFHPTVVKHPVTGEEILYISEGFTDRIVDESGADQPEILEQLLREVGMRDDTFTHPNIINHSYEAGEIVIWDNRVLSHRALHTTTNAATVSHRLTVLDEHPLSAE